MVFRCLISMFIILLLNINLAIGSKFILGTSQNFHKSYCSVVKAKSSFKEPNKTGWHQPHENLMKSICLVMNQKIKRDQPDKESFLINKLFQKIRTELYVGEVKMINLFGRNNLKLLPQQEKKDDFNDNAYDCLARNKALIKGFLGELEANNLMRYSGYDVLPCRLPSNQGIDHVFIKYARKVVIETIVIMESKYIYPRGRIKLSKSSEGIQQLSSAWLNKQMRALRTSKLHQNTLKILEEHKDKIQLHGYFIFADGKRVWRDYGRFDYHNLTCKSAKKVASCCPFSMSLGSVNQRSTPTKTKRKTRVNPFSRATNPRRLPSQSTRKKLRTANFAHPPKSVNSSKLKF